MTYTEMTDVELENAWQLQANLIAQYLTVYYSKSDESYRVKAEKAQEEQSKIQKEITRRH